MLKMKNLSITPCKQPINFQNAKKCLAKTRKKTPCQSPAMQNGRCRMHGGKSTGAKTNAGLKKISETHLKHGRYTKDNLALSRSIKELIKENKEFLNGF